MLRTASAAPIRISPAHEVEHVISFLPLARYQWTLHRAAADVVEEQSILRLTLDGTDR